MLFKRIMIPSFSRACCAVSLIWITHRRHFFASSLQFFYSSLCPDLAHLGACAVSCVKDCHRLTRISARLKFLGDAALSSELCKNHEGGITGNWIKYHAHLYSTSPCSCMTFWQSLWLLVAARQGSERKNSWNSKTCSLFLLSPYSLQ